MISADTVPQNPTIKFDPNDSEMDAAIRAAKESFGQFLQAFTHPAKGQRAFLVKAVFVVGEKVEHIWLADLDFSGNALRGVIANEPGLPGMKFKQSVEFEPSQITDWMYIEDSFLVGGYTTQVIRRRMSPEERKDFDASVTYKFR